MQVPMTTKVVRVDTHTWAQAILKHPNYPSCWTLDEIAYPHPEQSLSVAVPFFVTAAARNVWKEHAHLFLHDPTLFVACDSLLCTWFKAVRVSDGDYMAMRKRFADHILTTQPVKWIELPGV